MPSTRWYGVAVLVLVAGLTAAAAHLFLGFERNPDYSLHQLAGPGEITLQLSERGIYMILHEGEDFESLPPYVSQIEFAIASESPGRSIEFADVPPILSYREQNRPYVPISAFGIDGAGTFRLGIHYANDRDGPPVHLALGDAAFTRTAQVLAQSLWVVVISVLMSWLIAWVTFLRRRRHRRRQPEAV